MTLYDEIIKAIEDEVDKCGPKYIHGRFTNAWNNFQKHYTSWGSIEKDMRDWANDYKRHLQDRETLFKDDGHKKLTQKELDEFYEYLKLEKKYLDDFYSDTEKVADFISEYGDGIIRDYGIDESREQIQFRKSVDNLIDWGVKNRNDWEVNTKNFIDNIGKNGKNAIDVDYLKKTDKGWVAHIKKMDKEVPIILDSCDDMKDRIESQE